MDIDIDFYYEMFIRDEEEKQKTLKKYSNDEKYCSRCNNKISSINKSNDHKKNEQKKN